MFTHSTAIDAIKSTFPELQGELEDETWRDLLHPQIGCFARFTQQRIDAEDKLVAARCFKLADQIFSNCDAEVKNAMIVSYLEHLNLADGKKKRAWAFEALPPRLQQGFLEINRYLEELFHKKG